MASKYAPKKSMRPRSRNDAKGMSPKVKESSTRSPDGEYVKKMVSGGPTAARTQKRRTRQAIDDDEAVIKKYAERGTSGEAQRAKEFNALLEKFTDDALNIDRYGKDAPKGRSFGQKTQPKQGEMKKFEKKAYGGKMKTVKKMGSGGSTCRGMGAATRGGNFKMG